MAKTDTVYMRIDPTLKMNAEAILSNLGLTPNEAINIFLNQVVLQRGLPFTVKMPVITREEAAQRLMEELQKGEDSLVNEPTYTLEEIKFMLGV